MPLQHVLSSSITLLLSWLRPSTLFAIIVLLKVIGTCDSSAIEQTAIISETCSEETCATRDLDTATATVPISPTTTTTTTSDDDDECGVWLALSTLPGTGIGMFAGKEFRENETLMAAGDHIIPIVDFLLYQPANVKFLWDEYTWVRPFLSLCVSSGKIPATATQHCCVEKVVPNGLGVFPHFRFCFLSRMQKASTWTN